MIGSRRIIAVIPARGGSKGLPGKNIRPLLGKPLINWTIEKALRSKYLDRIIVSTDSESIARVAMDAGATVPFLRPPELATDHSPTIDAVDHVLREMALRSGETFDYLALLEPTSPLREDHDIDRMIARLHDLSGSFDGIVSLGEISHHPAIAKRIVDDHVHPFYEGLELTTRRQDNSPAYFPFCVAYILKTPTLESERTFYPERCTYYRIKRYQAIEIDDIYDFLAVEATMRHEWSLR